jgi:chaperonin GroES
LARSLAFGQVSVTLTLALAIRECQLTKSHGVINFWPGNEPANRNFFRKQEAWGPLMDKIRPLGDRILVKRIKEEEKTKGGIIIPDTAKEKPQEGKVVAVGKGKKTDEGKVIALDVKAGDRILFGKYSGSEIKLEGEEHLILREDDILGILE